MEPVHTIQPRWTTSARRRREHGADPRCRYRLPVDTTAESCLARQRVVQSGRLAGADNQRQHGSRLAVDSPLQGKVLARDVPPFASATRIAEGGLLIQSSDSTDQPERLDLYRNDGEPVRLVMPPSGIPYRSSRYDTRFTLNSDRRLLVTKEWGIAPDRSSRLFSWDVATGKLLVDFADQDEIMWTRSPRGDLRLLLPFSAQYRLQDVSSGDFVTPWLPLPPGAVASRPGSAGRPGAAQVNIRDASRLIFSPDGTRLLDSPSASILDARTGRVVVSLDPGERGRKPGNGLFVFSPDGRFVIDHVGDTYQRWDAETGKPAGLLMRLADEKSLDLARWQSPVTFSADGTRVLVHHELTFQGRLATSGGAVARVFEAATGKPLTPLLHHDELINVAMFSPDGRLILTGNHSSGTMRLWNADTGELATPPIRHPGELLCVGFSKDGRSVRTVCRQARGGNLIRTLSLSDFHCELHVWETATGQPLTPPLLRVDGESWISQSGTPSNYQVPLMKDDSDERTLLRLRRDGIVERTELSDDGRSVAEERAFAEALSNRRINDTGNLQPLDDDHLRRVWQSSRDRAWPEAARELLAPMVWHRHQAEAAGHVHPSTGTGAAGKSGRADVDAALWHLDRLLELTPNDPRALLLRVELTPRDLETLQLRGDLLDRLLKLTPADPRALKLEFELMEDTAKLNEGK
jgi:WD40 repeat protein